MGTLKLRFINKPENPNIGFTEHEIRVLGSTNFINPLSVFRDFLVKAGKKSNVLDTYFDTVEDYLEFQNKFRSLLRSQPDISVDSTSLFCFYVSKDFYHNHLYWFIDASQEDDSKLFYFSQGSVPCGENFRDDREQPIGMVTVSNSFVNYINSKTDEKFGLPPIEKIKSYLLAIVTFPIWLPLLISFKISKIWPGVSNSR